MINYFGTFAGDFENIKEQSTMQNEKILEMKLCFHSISLLFFVF